MSTDISSTSLKSMESIRIGSLWRRALAFAVDGIILYALGRIAGATLLGVLSRVGVWGRVLGFVIGLTYFATLESRIGGGHTFGKRLFGLRLTNGQGGLVGWNRAALRYTVCAVPFFLLGLPGPTKVSTWVLPFFIIFISLGIGGATLYLLIFNRHTRQGLHDLVADTYVIASDSIGPVKPEPIWIAHWWAVNAFLVLIAITALSEGIGIEWQQKSGHISQKVQDELLIEQLQAVQTAEVRMWVPTPIDMGVVTHLLPKEKPAIIVIRFNGKKEDQEKLAYQAAGIVLKHDPRAQKQKSIQIRIGRDYDLGIASGGDYREFSYTPAQWADGPGLNRKRQ